MVNFAERIIMSIMEENETKELKSSRMNVAHAGKWMNLFSIMAVLGMLLLVVAGIGMLFISNMLSSATPYYIDNIMGLGGVGLIVLAAALVFPVVKMREMVFEAKQIKGTQEVYPVLNYLRHNRKMWHYLAILITVLVCITVVLAVVAVVYVRSLYAM